jgi:hypothetical protein
VPRPLVALATCRYFPELDEDGPALLEALDQRGVEGRPVVWDDPRVGWDDFDLVVLRSTWDYTARHPEFVAWASSLPRLCNPASVVRWNTDKHYLAELAGFGVPTVPTAFLDPAAPGQAPWPPDLWSRWAGCGEMVVKPSVSAGARDTARFRVGDEASEAAARGHAAVLLAQGRGVMVQPYFPSVEGAGETALVHFDGVFSHAVRKGTVLDAPAEEPRDHPPAEVAGTALRAMQAAEVAEAPAGRQAIEARAAATGQRRLAAEVLAAVGQLVAGPDPLLYARVDLVDDAEGQPVLLEVELTEPSLFLGHAEGSAARFATVIEARARRAAATADGV